MTRNRQPATWNGQPAIDQRRSWRWPALRYSWSEGCHWQLAASAVAYHTGGQAASGTRATRETLLTEQWHTRRFGGVALLLLLLAAVCSLASATPPGGDREPASSQPTPPAEGGADDDLAEKLIRQATGRQDRGVMDEIMRLMDTSRSRLAREFDPGRQTQDVQRQVIGKLDDAVAAAQRQRRKARMSLPTQPSGDKRTAPLGPGQQPTPTEPAPPADGQAAGDQPADATAAGRGAAGQTAVGDRFRESRRGWGHLPARDRDEVLQGIDEDVVEKYRDLVERYFRALSEEEE